VAGTVSWQKFCVERDRRVRDGQVAAGRSSPQGEANLLGGTISACCRLAFFIAPTSSGGGGKPSMMKRTVSLPAVTFDHGQQRKIVASPLSVA